MQEGVKERKSQRPREQAGEGEARVGEQGSWSLFSPAGELDQDAQHPRTSLSSPVKRGDRDILGTGDRHLTPPIPREGEDYLLPWAGASFGLTGLSQAFYFPYFFTFLFSFLIIQLQLAFHVILQQFQGYGVVGQTLT